VNGALPIAFESWSRMEVFGQKPLKAGIQAVPWETPLRDTTDLLYHRRVTSNRFRRCLEERGCSFERGHGGLLIVRMGRKMSVLPMHGSNKELATGLVERIKRDLGLK
jgi:mRNA interferase HicA